MSPSSLRKQGSGDVPANDAARPLSRGATAARAILGRPSGARRAGHLAYRRRPHMRFRNAAAGLIALALCAGAHAQTLRIGLAEDPDVLDPTLARSFVGRIVF